MKFRFFQNIPQFKDLTFWYFNIIGWLLFWCGDVIIIKLQKIPAGEILSQSFDAPLGFLLAIVLRQVYLRIEYKRLSILPLIGLIAYWSIVFVVLWHVTMTTSRYFFIGPVTLLRLLSWRFVIPWLLKILPIWFGWSVLYFGIKYWRDWGIEQQRAQKAISLAQRAQLQMLRYQVNPHFLFNALNSVRALIDEDKKNAKSMITELSEFLRYSLITRDHMEMTLCHELDAIRHYLSIEKKRFEDKLDIAFEIDPLTEEQPILSFLIHPFVENAIKYGMKTSAMPLRIRIQTQAFNGMLRIVIANTGTWFQASNDAEKKSNGTGTGLENVRARLENAYPGHFRLETYEQDGWVKTILEIQDMPAER